MTHCKVRQKPYCFNRDINAAVDACTVRTDRKKSILNLSYRPGIELLGMRDLGGFHLW